MTKKSTPDERLLYRIYQLSGGDEEKEIDWKKAAASIGLKETAAKNIVKALAQANLLAKVGDAHVTITERGLRVVEELSFHHS